MHKFDFFPSYSTHNRGGLCCHGNRLLSKVVFYWDQPGWVGLVDQLFQLTRNPVEWLKTMGIDRYHNRGIRGLLSVCVMSTNKMAETINMEEYLQLVSLPATEFEETHNFYSAQAGVLKCSSFVFLFFLWVDFRS